VATFSDYGFIGITASFSSTAMRATAVGRVLASDCDAPVRFDAPDSCHVQWGRGQGELHRRWIFRRKKSVASIAQPPCAQYTCSVKPSHESYGTCEWGKLPRSPSIWLLARSGLARVETERVG